MPTAEAEYPLASTTNDALGSCYCINNNCGSNIVMTQLPYILYSLGSGVVGAIQKVSVGKYAISDGVVNGMMIAYTGQSTGECANRSNTSSIGVDLSSVGALTALFAQSGRNSGSRRTGQEQRSIKPEQPL